MDFCGFLARKSIGAVLAIALLSSLCLDHVRAATSPGGQFSVVKVPLTDNDAVGVKWTGQLPVDLDIDCHDEAGWSKNGSASRQLVQETTVIPLPCSAESATRYRISTSSGLSLEHHDRGVETGWQPRFVGPGPGGGGTIEDVVVYGGNLVVAGSFTGLQDQKARNIASWNGATWSPLAAPDGEEPFRQIKDLVVWDGKLVARGLVGGGQGNRVLAWDGTDWLPITDAQGDELEIPNIGGFSSLDLNGDLLITLGGSIARYDGQNWTEEAFPALGGEIRDMLLFDGSLYAAGSFQADSTGQILNHIARWNGTSWVPLVDPGGGIGLTTDSPSHGENVNDLTVFQGDLVAAGSFSHAGDSQAVNIAAWSGNEWTSLGSGLGLSYSGAVLSVMSSSSYLWAGGVFRSSGLTDLEGVAEWDGTTWSPLGQIEGLQSPEEWRWVSLLTGFNGQIHAFEESRRAGTGDLNELIVLSGEEWAPLDGPHFSTGVSAESVTGFAEWNGDMIVTGPRRGGRVRSHGVSRWDGDQWIVLPGSEDFQNLPGQWDVVSGEPGLFVAVNRTYGGVYAWTGSGWQRLEGVSAGNFSRPRKLLIHEGELYAAGDGIPSQGMPGIARWDGSDWQPLSGPSGDGVLDIEDMVVFNGDLIVAGAFTSTAGTNAAELNHVARWDGSDWSALSGPSGNGLSDTVYGLTIHEDRLVAGGAFFYTSSESGSDPIVVRRLAAWDGSDWLPLDDDFSPGAEPETDVTALASFDDSLFVAGDFVTIDGNPVNHIAEWDGENWNVLSGDDGIGLTNPHSVVPSVRAITVREGVLWVGGGFELAGGYPSRNLASYVLPLSIDLAASLNAAPAPPRSNGQETPDSPAASGATTLLQVTLDLENLGESTAEGTTWSMAWSPDPVSVDWTCEPVEDSGAICPVTSGTGLPNPTFDLPPGGGLRYSLDVVVENTTPIQDVGGELSADHLEGAIGTVVVELERQVHILGDQIFTDEFWD